MTFNRRNFLQLTSTIAGANLLASFKKLNTKQLMPATKGYQLKVFATNWGFNGTLDAFCAEAKKEGYDGIEHWWPGNEKEQLELFTLLKKYNLELGLLCGAGESSFNEHFIALKKSLGSVQQKATQAPVYINLHSGRDYFSFEDNCRIIEFTLAYAKQTSFKVYHETHRGRMLFAAPITNQFIQQYKDLKITLDISHWCNVHESMLDDQPGNVEAALKRTEHIHARVGYQEGPQVADPRAPEWEYALKKHIDWWDKIVASKKEEGEVITFLTEFGPPLYMQTLPYTLQPLSNQWEINVHMKNLLRNRYG